MAFDTIRCVFALLSSVILLPPDIAHHSMLLVLLPACIHSLEIKIRPCNDSSEITGSGGTGRFFIKHIENTVFFMGMVGGRNPVENAVGSLGSLFVLSPKEPEKYKL